MHEQLNTPSEIDGLRERAKELRCLYLVDELMKNAGSVEAVFHGLVQILPDAWQYPSICCALAEYEGRQWKSPAFEMSLNRQDAILFHKGRIVGQVSVFYTDTSGKYKFLPDELRLLEAVAHRIGNFLDIFVIVKSEKTPSNPHWDWRMKLTRLLIQEMNNGMPDVESVWLIGSTKDGNAGPASDIDLVVKYDGDRAKVPLLRAWFNGWGRAMAAWNLERTGCTESSASGLIDLHFITDDDIRKKSSYGIMVADGSKDALLLYKRKQ